MENEFDMAIKLKSLTLQDFSYDSIVLKGQSFTDERS